MKSKRENRLIAEGTSLYLPNINEILRQKDFARTEHKKNRETRHYCFPVFFIVNIKIFDGNKINLWLVLLNIIFK